MRRLSAFSQATRVALAVTLLAAVPTVAGGQTAAPPWPMAAPDPFAAVNSPVVADRAGGAARLGALGTGPAQSVLVQMLRLDPAPEVRAAAATAIGETRAGDLNHWLAEASARDPHAGVRAAAAAAQQRLWRWSKKPGFAFALAILPGAGHYYLGRPLEGTLYLSSIVGTIAAAGKLGVAALDQSSPSIREPIGLQLGALGQNLWFYSIFDAYRGARQLRENQGYRHPISDESLPELMSAPFRPSVLRSPWVWAGTPLLLGAAIGLSVLVEGGTGSTERTIFDGRGVNFFGHRFATGPGVALGGLYYGGLFVSVAVGEETLFRGALQTSLGESLGPYGGLAVASLLFGAVHIPNFLDADGNLDDAAKFALPFITASGATMGLVSLLHGNTLARSVAIHFWYNFLLTATNFALDPEHQPFVVQFAQPW